MAGYIFTLDSLDSLHSVVSSGIYSTNLKIPESENWLAHHEGTFADYLSMTEKDNVYFFIKRKIYGIGELININGDCKHLNFPAADIPKTPNFLEIKDKMIINNSDEKLNNRFLCTFRCSPNFFKEGVDMDEVLSSNPEAFKMLRVLWKLSFIKIDDIENKALFDVILKANEEAIDRVDKIFPQLYNSHERIKRIRDAAYNADSKKILDFASSGSVIRHEMAIEAAVIDYIKNTPTGIFGNWDYLSHQVVASPFKPVDYMDKMDVFGYRYIPSYKTVSKYLVIEIKKDIADLEVINQVMKYVDWVNQEYAFNDYSMIEAFIVAQDFPEEVLRLKEDAAKRTFIKGRRPTITMHWTNLRLIKYTYLLNEKKLEFVEI